MIFIAWVYTLEYNCFKEFLFLYKNDLYEFFLIENNFDKYKYIDFLIAFNLINLIK